MKNPFQAKENLKDKVLEQLDCSLPLRDAMSSEEWDQFDDFRHRDDGLSFVQEPYLEVGREYKRTQYTLEDLSLPVGGELLHPDVARAFARYLMEDDSAKASDVRLYEHQYRSLRAVKENQNLLVCTGTGSGKTECFLLPLVDRIYRDHLAAREAGMSYEPHVRALILYPLNALVNDQIKRLRRLLRYLPEVTFGQYIGTTEKDFETSVVPDELIEEGRRILDGHGAETDHGLEPSTALKNEWRSRSEWHEKAADILVTNHSMLERLLLLPSSRCRFFDHCWDFIVLDEAHSHSGSVGTEISWLMRRLAHRLERNAIGGEKGRIRFLATSATLSEGDDKVEQARHFASALFPASKESFAVEFGEYAELPSKSGTGGVFKESVDEFYRKHEDLYQRTVAYEMENERWKRARQDVDLMENALRNNGIVPASTLFQMRDLFDLMVRSPIPVEKHTDIEVTDEFRFLVKMALCKINPRKRRGNPDPRDKENWRWFLHDAALHAPSALSDDNITMRRSNTTTRNRVGNRLDVFIKWKEIDAGIGRRAVHYYVFHYLYLAVCDLVREMNLPLDESKFRFKLTQERLTEFSERVKEHTSKGAELAEKKKRLDQEWASCLHWHKDATGYPDLLYHNLVNHEDYRDFEGQTLADRPMPVAELVLKTRKTSDAIEHLISLGALARLPPQVRRHPLIEVRYHQVIRDVADVGVYFEDGDLAKPRFVRNTEEYHEGKEKIFSLGVCRKCGQPYLLGYTEDKLEARHEQASVPMFRTRAGKFRYMHAFAWKSVASIDDAEVEYPARPDTCYWLDLRTGCVRVSNAQPQRGNWTQMHWGIVPGHGPSQIEKCKCCGAQPHGSSMTKYGIVTPYEAIGDQYRVMVLNAFAELCEEETEAHNGSLGLAGGRKVLAFSDSRGQAARLASIFEDTNERRLLDYLALKLVKQACSHEDYPDGVKEKIAAIEKLMALDPNMVATLSAQLEQLRHSPRIQNNTPNFLRILGDSNASLLVRELSELHFLQVLDWETSEGDPVVDQGLVGRFLLLRTLRDPARQGLMRRALVVLSSAMIAKESQWTELLVPDLGINENTARELCQTIYAHLVRQCQVKVPDEFCWLDEQGVQRSYLDQFWRKPITSNQFTNTDKGSAIYWKIVVPKIAKFLQVSPERFAKKGKEDKEIKEIKNRAKTWLEAVWRHFTDHWNILQQNMEGAYLLQFDVLCGDGRNTPGDLQVSATPEAQTAGAPIPFSIEEHTAQVRGEIGAAYQKAFAEGRINILSCSTTFEMGIDVGGLNNVFLGNLPSSSSSYRQRAGRAGRRPGASAYILSLAGHGAHDQYYYSDAAALFWGTITPPAIYLEKPVFAARHMRAEALHLFLEYVDDKENKLFWNKISDFIIGWRKTGRYTTPKTAPIGGGTICERFLGPWQKEHATDVQQFIQEIEGYREFMRGLGDSSTMYSATGDLAFQLVRVKGDLQRNTDAHRFYQCMGGCRLPERTPQGLPIESQSPKRMALKDRLLHLLHQQGPKPDAGEKYPEYEKCWPGNGITPAEIEFAQAKTLMKETISVLTETCILPRYGFAVDEITLRFDGDELHKDVELTRPLQIGLYEYAPGQVVLANKRKYQSWRAAIMRWPRDTDPEPYLALRLSRSGIFCPECRKLFENLPLTDGSCQCPQCGTELRQRKFVTPEAFYACPSRGSFSSLRAMPRGEPIMHWGGELCQPTPVPETCFVAAESSDRMMQYLNTNYGDVGFYIDGSQNLQRHKVNDRGGHYYVHEVQTNIAIWEFEPPGFLDSTLASIDYRVPRALNACQSALYALRKGIALRLGVTPRDIGVLLQDVSAIKFHFVFFDTAAGGGGNALALTMRNEHDDEGAQRIRGFIVEAIRLLESDCGCKCMEDYQPSQKPLPMNVYQTLVDGLKPYFRPAVACYGCLKDYDNQRLHAVLDKYDALEVLRYLLNPDGMSSALESDATKWSDFNGQLRDGVLYKLKNGKEAFWEPLNPKFGIGDVLKQERDEV